MYLAHYFEVLLSFVILAIINMSNCHYFGYFLTRPGDSMLHFNCNSKIPKSGWSRNFRQINNQKKVRKNTETKVETRVI